MSLGDWDGKRYSRITNDACGSFFFKRFIEGMRARMGSDWRPNLALSTTLIVKLLDRSESRIDSSTSKEDKHHWMVFLTYVTVSYVISLRGPEGWEVYIGTGIIILIMSKFLS